MTRSEISNVIDILLPQMPAIDFALIGTCNLYIQGITELVPNDFDLITNDEGVKEISRVFDSEIFTDGEPGYLETQFELNGIEIHFVSTDNNPLRPNNFQNFVKTIEFEGKKVPCLTLESEYEAYSKMNREKDKRKLELIRAVLEKV